jgi:hypothetical protein
MNSLPDDNESQKWFSLNAIYTLPIKANGRDNSIWGSVTKMREAVNLTCPVSRMYLLKRVQTIRALT